MTLPDDVRTPALVLDLEAVRHNVAAVVALLGGDADRWRPHIKTCKSASVVAELRSAGVRRFKCATALELELLCGLGAEDVLLAYPLVGPAEARVAQIAAASPATTIAVLADDPEHAAAAGRAGVGVFADLDPGLGRTGIPLEDRRRLAATIDAAIRAGAQLRGLHCYGADFGEADTSRLRAVAHRAYSELVACAEAVRADGHDLGEIVVAGTPGLPSALDHPGLAGDPATVRFSPGTVVLGDLMSLGTLDGVVALRPAATVLTRVISRPGRGRMTLDAGHKAVSADAGVPTGAVVGRPSWALSAPTEEHQPVVLPDGGADDGAPLGTAVQLVPRHVCPTVNLYDEALIVDGDAIRVEAIGARGHDGPLAISPA